MSIKIFCCYAHEDEVLLNQLKIPLRPLQRQNLIDIWHDRDINAGKEWQKEIDEQLNSAAIILLLVSPDFMDSEYCYSIEMMQAIERHERGEVVVIPIILRPVYWQGVLDKLQALPTDAKPITSSSWHDLDEAFFDVVEGIHRVIAESTSTNKWWKQSSQSSHEEDLLSRSYKDKYNDFDGYAVNEKALELLKNQLMQIEKSLDSENLRILTRSIISRYEEEIRSIILEIRKASTSSIATYDMELWMVILEYLRRGRDQLNIALDVLEEKGRTTQYYKSLGKCRKYLEDAIQRWYLY